MVPRTLSPTTDRWPPFTRSMVLVHPFRLTVKQNILLTCISPYASQSLLFTSFAESSFETGLCRILPRTTGLTHRHTNSSSRIPSAYPLRLNPCLVQLFTESSN